MASRTRVPTRDLCVLVAFLVLLALAARSPNALAQGPDTGAVEVVVRASDGSGVPDAEVRLDGPQREYTTRTGVDGVVRFRGLIPGVYRATVSVAGFAPARTSELEVVTSELRRIRIELEPLAVDEEVLVIAAHPIFDATNVSVGALIDDQLVARTPSGGGLWNAILDKVPGVVLGEVDVGGAHTTRQQRFTAHGSPPEHNQFYLNGAQTTNFHDGGSGTFYSPGALTEVAVSTFAHDIQYQAPGVVVNMVSKSGTNQVHGGFRFAYSNDDLVGDNLTPELLALGLEKGVPNTLVSDLDLQLGGPLVRDRLWGFANHWRVDEERLILGVPDDERDENTLRNATVNLDWRFADRQRLSFRYFFNEKFRVNVGASATLAPALSSVLDPGRDHNAQVNWQASWSDNVYSDLRVAFRDSRDGTTGRRADSAAPHSDFPVGVPNGYDLITGVWSGAPYEFRDSSRSWEVNGHVAAFVGGRRRAHDLKAGFGFVNARHTEHEFWPEGVFQWFLAGEPAWVDLVTTPADSIDSLGRELGERDRVRFLSLFLQDSLAIGDRWTLSAGLRWDHQSARVPEQSRPDSRWAGLIPESANGALFRAGSFEPIDVMSWNDLVPRVALSFDPTGSGETALHASYGQYALQQLGYVTSWVNPNDWGFNEYDWNDPNGDRIFQWGEQGALVWESFPSINTRFDPELAAPTAHDFTLGIEHRIRGDLVVGATWIYRTIQNVVDNINVGAPYGPIADRLGVESSWTPVVVTDPGPDGMPGTADDGGQVTVWSRARSARNEFLITNPEEWGFDAPYDYRGLELVARKRFGGRWQMLASWTIGATNSSLGNLGFTGLTRWGTFNNPNLDNNRFGRTLDDRTHLVKVNASYLFPRPLDIGVGLSLRHESGKPFVRRFQTDRGVVNQGRQVVFAAGIGEDDGAFGGRMPSITILDLRADKSFTMPGRWGRLTVGAEVFNLFNESAARSIETLSGPGYGRITAIVPPRMFRLAASWVF